jgi:hypothetical protein
MTRATLGTRVNPEGLVEDVALLGSEEVVDGNFPLPNTNWILGGSGSNIPTIGTNDVTINSVDGNSYIQQSGILTSGKHYKITYDVISASATSNVLKLASSFGMGSIPTSVGPQIVYGTAVTSNLYIERYSNGVNATITNVSVKEATIDNLPRVDYTDGTSSLLVEPLRTNLVTYSEDFSQWVSTQVTIEPNATTSPDGTLNASRITPTTTSSVHLISTSGSTTMAISIYAKSNGYHRFRFNSGSSGNGYASFDLNAGTVISSGGTYYTSSSIDSVGNGWYRCTLVLTSGVTSVTTLAIEDNSGNVSFIGDGTSAIYTWGGQSEVGSYPTSYIKTSGGTVTRVQETYEKTGISNLINSTEGVLFVEIAALVNSDTTNPNRGISISSGSTNNTIYIYFQSSTNQFSIILISGGTTQFLYSTTSFDVTSFNKVALKYKQNDFALWVNGVEVATDSSGNTPTGLSKLSFDNGAGNDKFFGKVKQLQVFKTALTDDELTILTGTSGVHFFPSYGSMAAALTYTIE